MNKTYCVLVYTGPFVYEGVKATSPEHAEDFIIKRDFAGDFNQIHEVEVMICCPCGLDNDTSAQVCLDCGEPL